MRTKLSHHLRRLLGTLPGVKAQKEEPAPTAAPEPLTDTELRVQ